MKTAYENWILQKARDLAQDESEMEDFLAKILAIECYNHNNMAFDIVEKAGDEFWNENTFKKAAKLLLNK